MYKLHLILKYLLKRRIAWVSLVAVMLCTTMVVVVRSVTRPVAALGERLRSLNDEGTTVFLTTQYLEEADQLADNVGIIDSGRIVAEGTPERLKAEVGNPHIQLHLADGSVAQAEEVCARIGKLLPPKDGRTVLVEVENGAADIPRVVRALDEGGIAVESLELVRPTLDDVFVAKTGYHLEEEDAQEDGEAVEA